MKLELDYVSLSGDIYFEILNEKEQQIGEVEVMDFPDSYTVSIKAYKESFGLDKEQLNKALIVLFEDLFNTIEDNVLIFFEDKHVLLLDNDLVNGYAQQHNLEKVPRYCGYFLYKREDL